MRYGKRPPPPDYRKASSCVYANYHYIIWKPKNLDDGSLAGERAREAVREAVGTVCRGHDIGIECLAIWKESAHLLCSIPPKYAALTIADALKDATARTLMEGDTGVKEYPWSDDFYSQTVGREHLEDAKRMIAEGDIP